MAKEKLEVDAKWKVRQRNRRTEQQKRINTVKRTDRRGRDSEDERGACVRWYVDETRVVSEKRDKQRASAGWWEKEDVKKTF